MNALKGRVRAGRIEVDAPLPEGAEVVVLMGDGSPFELGDDALTELEERMAAADQGEVEPAAALIEKLRRAR